VLTCKELIDDFLHDYQAGALTGLQRAKFEFHLALCAPCRKYLDSYKKTVVLAQATIDQPAEVTEELIKAILAITAGQIAAHSPPQKK
jgi:hypothetical protein